MFCRKCGKEIPNDSTFCPKCGTAVGKEISEKVNPSENKTVSNKLEKTSLTDMPNKEPTSNAQDRVLLTKCSHCGVMYRPYPGQTTCQKCGALLEYAERNVPYIGAKESQPSVTCAANAAPNSLTQDKLVALVKSDEVKTVSDNNTNAYETITTPLNTTPSSNAFDNFVSKTAIAARVIIAASLILYIILENGVLKKLDEASGIYGWVTAAIGFLGVCFIGSCACRIVCAFVKGAREEKDLGWMIFVTVILFVIALILGLILKSFVGGMFIFALALFAYCENRLRENE